MKKQIPFWKMRRSLCKGFLIFCFLFSGWIILQADNSARGYLVTKNGIQLTGVISEIFDYNYILFINDFGTPYKIHAAMVYGFVVPRKGRPVFYASKFNGKKWRFMQLLHKGEGMNLYAAPAVQVPGPPGSYGGQLLTQPVRSNAYYVELKGRLPVEIRRGNFKRSMRKLLKKEAPEMAKKIGSKGYRYKNLEVIIEEYNQLIQKERISL